MGYYDRYCPTCEHRVVSWDAVSACNGCRVEVCPNCAGSYHEVGSNDLYLDACSSCHPVCVGCHEPGAEDQDWWPDEGPLCRACIGRLWEAEAHLYDVEFTPPGLGHPSMPSEWRAPANGEKQEA